MEKINIIAIQNHWYIDIDQTFTSVGYLVPEYAYLNLICGIGFPWQNFKRRYGTT